MRDRKRKRPRRWTGSGRVRERLEAVEIPLKRTNQSQKARQRLFVSVLIDSCCFNVLDSWWLGKLQPVQAAESAGD